jgi:hypothetical protein
VSARVAAALVLGFASFAAPGAADWNVARLFEMLSREKPARAEFREKKYLALLDKPVESSGELVFTPPHTLEKRTVFPKPERVLVDRDRVTLERGGRTFTMGLRENPQVAILVESIRGTLAGDLASLTRTYSAGLEGDAAAWRLKLRPLDPSLATLVERIEISGSLARVKTVEIFQADGDRSVMSLAPAPR